MVRKNTKEVLLSLKKHIQLKRKFKNINNVTNVMVGKEFGVEGVVVQRWLTRDKFPDNKVLDYCAEEELNPIPILYKKV